MDVLRIGSILQSSATTLDILLDKPAVGLQYVSVVCPIGMTVSPLENLSKNIPVLRGTKIPMETKRGYRFTIPATYHGSVGAYGTDAQFNNSSDTKSLDGSIYCAVYDNACEMELHELSEYMECELAITHTGQYDGAIVTTSWGFRNLQYNTVEVQCRNTSNGYTVPFYLVDQPSASERHNAKCLGYLTACHLTDAVTYAEGGMLSLANVRNLRIFIAGNFAYLLNDSSDTTVFYYRFVNRVQQVLVAGKSVLKGYSTWTTSNTYDIPMPVKGYGFFQCYNISGVAATATYIYRMTFVQYNNNLQVNSDPNAIMAGASLGGGASRAQAGGASTGCDYIRFGGTSAGTVTLLWTVNLQHEYI